MQEYMIVTGRVTMLMQEYNTHDKSIPVALGNI